MIKKAFQSLQKVDLSTYKKKIKPLNPAWREYNCYVTDYSTDPVAVSNRLIPAYNGSSNHGDEYYTEIVKEINRYSPESIVDLGCASGELLDKLSCKYKFGLTIHTGEVRYARDVYGLTGVIPADLRNVGRYFHPESLDMIVAFWSLNYITMQERTQLLKVVHKLLKSGKQFICVDEYGYKDTILPEVGSEWAVERKEIHWGTLTVLTKNV